MADKIRIILADDHEALRADTRSILERQPDIIVVGEAGDGQTAVELTEFYQPDVVLMDLSMPGLDGLEATRQIRSRCPHTAVLILSCHDEEELIRASQDAGAAGYLVKSVRTRCLLLSLRTVYQGKALR